MSRQRGNAYERERLPDSKLSSYNANEIAYGEPAGEMGVQQKIVKVLRSQVWRGTNSPHLTDVRLEESYRDGQLMSNEIGWTLQLTHPEPLLR